MKKSLFSLDEKIIFTQPTFTFSKSKMELPEKYVISDVVLVSLLLTMNRFHTLL